MKYKTTCRSRTFTLLFLTLIYYVFSIPVAMADPGVWATGKKFTSGLAPSLTGCSRVYQCTTGLDMIINESERIEATPPVTVGGVCLAGNGPVDDCNACLTNPPEEPCEWSIVKRE